MKVQSNEEKKMQVIKVLQNLITEIQKSPELLESDIVVSSKDDSLLYQAVGLRRTVSRTFEICVEIK